MSISSLRTMPTDAVLDADYFGGRQAEYFGGRQAEYFGGR